jgi:hypothetical protein
VFGCDVMMKRFALWVGSYVRLEKLSQLNVGPGA